LAAVIVCLAQLKRAAKPMASQIEFTSISGTLTLGLRVETFNGMENEITFNIAWIKPSHGTGGAVEDQRRQNSRLPRL
jgi:hypothetical protein